MRLVPPLHRANHRIGLFLADLRDEGLSQGEAHILALLATSAPATIAELHRGLAHKRSTLTSILDRLAERGLVTRQVGATDRRTFVITPTAKGAPIAKRVNRHLIILEEAVARRVTADEVKAFLKVVSVVEDEAHQRTTHTKVRLTGLSARAARSHRTPAPARDR